MKKIVNNPCLCGRLNLVVIYGIWQHFYPLALSGVYLNQQQQDLGFRKRKPRLFWDLLCFTDLKSQVLMSLLQVFGNRRSRLVERFTFFFILFGSYVGKNSVFYSFIKKRPARKKTLVRWIATQVMQSTRRAQIRSADNGLCILEAIAGLTTL